MLAPVVAAVEEVDHPAARKLIEGGDHLCGDGGVAQQVGVVDDPEAGARRRPRKHGERRPALQDRLVAPEHEVVGDPEGVVAEGVGLAR